MPLRPPGETLRLKIDDLSNEFETAVMLALMIGVVAFSMVAVTPAGHKWPVAIGASVAVAITYFGSARNILRIQKQLWEHRLGFTGERVVGEELNRLMARGFHIFHDLPFDGFNIDHVVVGPSGVYVVETKTRSKPADLPRSTRATVYYDGVLLTYPKWKDQESISQVRLNAKTLSTWLSRATGEHTPVKAILAIPGWWIERTAKSDVNVLNPKEIKNSFPSNPVAPLPPDRIQRIVHQLTERCRLSS